VRNFPKKNSVRSDWWRVPELVSFADVKTSRRLSSLSMSSSAPPSYRHVAIFEGIANIFGQLTSFLDCAILLFMTHTTHTNEAFIDDRGFEHLPCHMCGSDCSTHPDAANPLSSCGDCGKATCPDHRVEDDAQRCNACAAIFYANEN
jgi:hypothetical protein